MITYPAFNHGATIGITAPSSGVPADLHSLIQLASERMQARGFRTIIGDTVWTQHKAKSAPAQVRAAELNAMLQDDQIDLIQPPWGGELLVEILEYVDFEAMKCKWIMGYSDISVLLLAVTLRTGLATAHGTNIVDLRGEECDDTTAMWQAVLSAGAGESIVQHSSAFYQKEWSPDAPSPRVFHLNEPTEWKTISNSSLSVKGRLLGGCVDVIRHLIGTPYGDVEGFRSRYLHDEPLLWYLENCELSTVDLRRSLVQMKLAGWFDHCAGILFGRSPANRPLDGYTVEDVYTELAEELHLPIAYNLDFGHVPPQITLINGAYAEVEVADGRGTVRQFFYP